MRPSPRIFLQPLFGAFRTIVPAFLATAIVPLFAQGLTPTMSVRGDGKAVAKFTNVGTGTWTVPAGVTEVEVLVVGGGGGASWHSGGGGAGGLYHTLSYSVTPGTNIAVAVGAGGARGVANGGGQNGANSVFDSIIAYGGQGENGSVPTDGVNQPGQLSQHGGNQGNHSADNGTTIVLGKPGGGGTTNTYPGYQASGGGAGFAGVDGNGQAGGNGVQIDITGSNLYYAGGGASVSGGAAAAGGLGGGGSGGSPSVSATDGAPNTGGGAGGNFLGAGGNGCAGGSGVVIVAYNTAATFYSVSFNSNGGSAVADQNVEAGQLASVPTTPTWTGHTFVEWCSDEALTIPFSFSTPIESNTTLYAKWLVNYVVTFVSNGGSAVPVQYVVPPGASISAPAAPTKTGNTFIEWCSDEALSTPFDFQATITGDTTLYAKWLANNYTLTYAANSGGSFDGTSPQTVAHGSSGSTVTAMPEPGYRFVKWSDGLLTRARTDSNVTGNINVTANFELLPTNPITPTTETTRGDGKTLVIFTQGSGVWNIPNGVTQMEVLVVGGGGGNWNNGFCSGSGAGGMYYASSHAVTPGPVTVTVGTGGNSGDGSHSSFGSELIAYGGQGSLGGGYQGGNQGGHSSDGAITIVPGKVGGLGVNQFGSGGGAGAVGTGGNSQPGGIGLQCAITTGGEISGTTPYYAGGGGSCVGGLGGLGGGGSGPANFGDRATSGAANTGGGGGGGWGGGGGSGGSGVVIVAYTISASATTVELDSDVNPSTEGSSVTFTASVKDGAATATSATGTIEFKVDDVVVEAAAAIVNGVATYTTSSLAAGARSVTATYSGDSTYGSSFVTMTQTVTADPYDAWASASGYNLTGGRDDDDDGDGVSNFQEFAFGLNPTDAASSNPIVDISDLKNGIFTYTRHATSTLTYTVLASTDLQQWAPVGFSEDPGAPDEATGVVTVVVSLDDPPTQGKFFVRVQASEPPAPQ